MIASSQLSHCAAESQEQPQIVAMRQEVPVKNNLDLAFKDYLTHSSQALMDIHDADTMRLAVLFLLIEARFTYANMVKRIRSACSLPQFAFNAMLEHARDNPLRLVEFATAVGMYNVHNWNEFNITIPNDMHMFFSGVEGATWLYERHKCGAIGEEHPFYVYRGGMADFYWHHRVSWFAAHGDFKRAWDELNKGRRGVVANGTSRGAILDNTAQRMFVATHGTVGEAAIMLFMSMVEKGALEELVLEDFVVPSGYISGRVLETKLSRNGRRPENRAWSFRRPGIDFALEYPRSAYDLETDVSTKVDGQLLKQGAAILKMAEHFSKQDNETRLRKHERALQEHATKYPHTKKTGS